MKKTILYIWDADYPWDVRVEKICRSLISGGYEVHIASRNLKNNPTFENDRELNIHRMKNWNNDRINYAFSFPVFFSPLWKRFLDSIITRHSVDLIIVRDLPMAIAGVLAGRRHGLPVIFDMAEDYVAMIRDIWRARKYQGLNLIVRNPYLAKIVEKYSVQNASHIFIVAEEAKKVIVNAGGNLKNTTVVGNTPSLEIFFSKNHMYIPSEKLEIIKKRFSVIYTGGIQNGRGIQTVIGAIPHLIEKIPDFLFVVVGEGYAEKKMQEKVEGLGIQKHVMWVGWVKHDLMYNYIKASTVGLIPHLVSDHVNTTIPNKLFDYMGFGLPIIATDAIPLKRIIKDEKCGKIFKSNDVNDFIKVILQLYHYRGDYGYNGIKAIINRYNWEKDEEKLFEAVSNLLV